MYGIAYNVAITCPWQLWHDSHLSRVPYTMGRPSQIRGMTLIRLLKTHGMAKGDSMLERCMLMMVMLTSLIPMVYIDHLKLLFSENMLIIFTYHFCQGQRPRGDLPAKKRDRDMCISCH